MSPMNSHQHKFDIYRADIVSTNNTGYENMYQFLAGLDLFLQFIFVFFIQWFEAELIIRDCFVITYLIYIYMQSK